MSLLARVVLVLVLVAPATACTRSLPSPAADGGFASTGDGAVAYDPCATDGSPGDTVGCNGGWASEAPAPNQMGGACDTSTSPAGSCEGDALCMASGGLDVGRCALPCDAGPWLVATGGCPTGSRCHRFVAPVPVCLRDCDDAHACPAGLACDQGRCIGVTP